jgi:hypothetical protein
MRTIAEQANKAKELLSRFNDTDIQIKVFDENFGEFITKINKKYDYEVTKKLIKINTNEFELEGIISIKPINLTLEERIDKINESDTLEIAMAYLSDTISSYEIIALETIKAKHHNSVIKKRIADIKSNISKEIASKHSKLSTESILSHMLLNISKISKIEQIKNLAQLNEYTQKAICKAIKVCECDIF